MSAVNDRSTDTVPLPLGYAQSVKKAVELRNRGWSFSTIADVVAVYHGFSRNERWWRRELRGMVEPDPRGVPFTEGGSA